MAAASHSEIGTVGTGVHCMDRAQTNVAALSEGEVSSAFDRNGTTGVRAASKRPAHAVAIGKRDEEVCVCT